MQTCYHVTVRRRMESIKKEGLVPLLGEISDLVLEPVPAVFLFKELEEVRYAMDHWMGDAMYHCHYKEEPVLLCIQLPDHFPLEERHGWELVSRKRIPPEYIEELPEQL